MDSDYESKLISLFTKLFSSNNHETDSDEGWGASSLIQTICFVRPLDLGSQPEPESKFMSFIVQIISLVKSLDLESQPKPESEFMSLIDQTKHVFKFMDLDSQPKPLSKLISLCTKLMNPTNLDSSAQDVGELFSLFQQTWELWPEPKLISLIYQILVIVSDMVMNPKCENLISLCPREQVILGRDDVICIDDKVEYRRIYSKWVCLNTEGKRFKLGGESYFSCRACNGQNHEKYEKARAEIKHPFHPKHSLQLVFREWNYRNRKCCCCDEDLGEFIYCCLACNYAMNVVCVKKPHILSMNIDYPKWHEHSLVLFSRTTSLICDVCALVDSTLTIYICPPCGFVVHRICLDLPHFIKISRHPQHRIAFTPSFNQGNWSCGVCRNEIHNDYGGYTCTKSGCSYAAHSKCATQENVWDGKDLEGVSEEDDIEDIEPFVRISDGIIQHFCHKKHHLRLDENTERDYNEDKLCEACITPIYSGNLYACMQCDFILHEECAKIPLKMYHPTHPHMLALVQKDGNVTRGNLLCSACLRICAVGLFYECHEEGCKFQVHVQCGVISEPLVCASHMHPLFLTSKPGEMRNCSVCRKLRFPYTSETFNCIECEFSLCFRYATLPQKVRYKHDKPMFILSYEEERSTVVSWCEVCEGTIDTKNGFYTCDKDCCVTLHIKCTIGRSLYMKPSSSWFYDDKRVDVVPKKQQMTRPICFHCKERCPKASFQVFQTGKTDLEEAIFCSISCVKARGFNGSYIY